MAIDLHAVGARFSVNLTEPHGDWRSDDLLTPTDVLRELSARGCQSTDITDALDATGVDWRPLHNAEVRRGRGEDA